MLLEVIKQPMKGKLKNAITSCFERFLNLQILEFSQQSVLSIVLPILVPLTYLTITLTTLVFSKQCL